VEKYFRADAHSDNFAILRNHLQQLGLPENPKLMLEGTIRLCRLPGFLPTWMAADGPVSGNQPYDPSKAPDPRYIFTFDLCGKAYARS